MRLWTAAGGVLFSALAIGCGPDAQRVEGTSSAELVAYSPMVASESFQKRWSGTDPSCFAVDDQYSFSATGSLAPGESFTFEAVPTCDYAELPAIAIRASWDASELEVTSVVPANDGISDDLAQAATPVKAAVHGNSAHLCMFTSAWGEGQGFGWAVTIRNTGTETAYQVKLEGQESNGWLTYFHNRCARADADGDGWNDSLEHGMKLLTYYASYPTPATKWTSLDGTNYLRASSSSAAPDDEVDAYPPDVNDDGVVDQADVARVASFVGQGSGIALDEVSSDPGPSYVYEQAKVWRRYDLDGSGTVSSRDVEIVQALVGAPIPMPDDVIAPSVELRSPASGASVSRGSYQLLEAYGWDDRWLTRVDFFAAGKLVGSSTGGEPTQSQTHQYTSWWKVPKKPGSYVLTAKAYDAAGHSATSSLSVTVK